PYISPNLIITPTSHLYNAFLGAKGKFTESIGYNFKGTYGKTEKEAFFISRPSGFMLSEENYQYGNSFGLVYDDLSTLGLHAELSADVNEDFQLRLKVGYFNYETEQELEAWNLPELKASLNANYQITEKWSAGADLFFVGERKDR
ncbi:hypothetical protein, partial [Acinetobacter baumannii]|uniref:hypothetical protein n=1 Tax=Acinetobacter baumannii TaxID=470 RepID=UPI0018E0BA2F